MPPAEEIRNVIVVDIETVGEKWESLPDKLREYLVEREKEPKDKEEVPKQMGLSPGTGRVVVIAVLDPERNKGALFLEGEGGESSGWTPWPRDSRFQVVHAQEGKCLELFWNAIRPYRRVVTFNGRAFDGPFLMTRSAVHGVPPSRNLVGNRYELGNHCDLIEVFTYQGAVKKFSLEYWCRAFGIEAPKVTMEGKDVQEFYESGRMDEIVDYCRAEVIATAQLYDKIERTVLPFMVRAK